MNRIDSMGDFIYVEDDVMDKDFCSHLITKFEGDIDHQYKGLTAGGIKEDVKNTTDLRISGLDHWNNEDQKVCEFVGNSMNQYIHHLEKFFIGYFNLNDIRPASYSDTGYQIQRYQSGGGYSWHQDFMTYNGVGARMFTFIFYLNDVDIDGYTEFCDGTRVRPKAGRVLWFPATWTYIHRGYPPKDGLKYILTGWSFSQSFEIDHSIING